MAQQTDTNSIIVSEQLCLNVGTTLEQPWDNQMLYKYYNLNTYVNKTSEAQLAKELVSYPGEPGSGPPLTLLDYFDIIRVVDVATLQY